MSEAHDGWLLDCPCCDWWFARKAWWLAPEDSRAFVLRRMQIQAPALVEAL